MERLSPWELWREGYLPGDPEGYVEKALETGISFHRSPSGEPGRGSSNGDFDSWMKGALGMERLSLKRLHGGGLGDAPSLGTLEDMLRKTPNKGISLHRGPFPAEGNMESGRGLVY